MNIGVLYTLLNIYEKETIYNRGYVAPFIKSLELEGLVHCAKFSTTITNKGRRYVQFICGE